MPTATSRGVKGLLQLPARYNEAYETTRRSENDKGGRRVRERGESQTVLCEDYETKATFPAHEANFADTCSTGLFVRAWGAHAFIDFTDAGGFVQRTHMGTEGHVLDASCGRWNTQASIRHERMRYTVIEFERHARVLYPVSSPTICYMRLWRLHIRVYDHRCTSVRSSYRRSRCSPRGPKSSSAGLILLAAFHTPRFAGRPSSSTPCQRPSPGFAAAAPAEAGLRLGRLSPV